MSRPSSNLDLFLDELASRAQPGDRVPTIRDLMRRFAVSQGNVERAFLRLKERGLIESRVGRGTHFVGAARGALEAPDRAELPAARRKPAGDSCRSVLLLRRSISVARGRMLAEGLHRRLVDAGHRVLELTYTDSDHAMSVLHGLPRFDACVVQSTYRTLPIGLLAALKARCEVVAVDGAALMGADVESVGTEWGEPLAEAVQLLLRHGHRRLAFAGTSQPFLATQMAWRRLEGLVLLHPEVHWQRIAVPQLPDQDYAQAVVGQLAGLLDGEGRLPVTGLVVWGVEDGADFRRRLQAIGVQLPDQLSVVLLGRTDLVNEHADFFDIVGTRVSDQVEALYAALLRRWSDPAAPYGVQLTPVTSLEGRSVTGPRAAAGPLPQRAQA